ncbi:hypothetical protein GPECTOR_3g489 [Gonium pectorale]|uniref:Uncharacterized protein n=1 Tax=Gonium pectorale TaxID=33097 RepID=A0A150GZR9_GONPE|nr:hypothetical protein GPECTOR_3g489 [Gonium pectorale]|eukprot:KXZ55359.1 hypothetical protein GPECTOR_3g489 [Gonium pectorale]
MLSQVRPGRPAPVEELASAIDAADQALAAARQQQCSGLEALYTEEGQLEADIEAIASRLDADLEVEAGGWDPEDHEEFLAVLRSCGGDYSHAVSIVVERAVGYSRAEVLAHARWHMELADLEVRKRVALEAWRQERQRRRDAAMAASAALGSDTAALAQRERQRDQASCAEAAALVEMKKAMAARWRAEQQERQRQEAEAARQRAEKAAAARRAELEQRQALNKMRLAEVKRMKEQQRREAERRAAAEAAIKAALSVPTPQQRQRVADRSRATFLRRQSLLASRDEARGQRERVQQQLLEKVHVEAPSDPSRLLQGTAAQMQRLELQRSEQRVAKDSGFILHVAKRVTPGWRAGLAGG